MVDISGIPIHRTEISSFCKRNGIKALSLFGSITTDEFTPLSDIDVIVEFEIGKVPGLIRMARMERELAGLFGGRKIDLRTLNDLSRYFRDDVMAKRIVLYAAS